MEATSSRRSGVPAAVSGVILLVGIGIGLIGQFVLDSLADSNDTWHEVQHGTIFVAGLIVGWALTSLYAASRRSA